jgi:peptide/nickel transport system permease protein
VTDMFLSFPTLLFALTIMAAAGPGFDSLVLALTLKGWTEFARLTRSQVLSIKEQEYVLGAHAIGAGHARIVTAHVLRNSLSIIFVYASLAITTPILAEAALSFLGLGLSPPTPSLGLMLAGERSHMLRAWWTTAFPGLAIMLLILGFNLLGDGLRDALDPRTALRHRSS